MSHFTTKRVTDPILSFLLCAIVVSIFWSPYFTPFDTVGAAGILRIDQILLLLFIAVYFVRKPSFVKIPRYTGLLSLLVMVVIIFTSLLIGLFIFDFPVKVGDTFNVFRWATYFVFFVLLIQILSLLTIRLLTVVILLSGVSIAFLGIFQFHDFLGIHQLTGEIYLRESRFENWGNRPDRAYGTTPNPNMYAQLLSIPLLLSTSLLLHTIYQQVTDNDRYAMFIFLALSTAVLAYAVFLTYSRTGIILILIGAIFIFLTFILNIPHQFGFKYMAFGSGIIFLVLFAVLYVFGVDVGRYRGLLSLGDDSSLQFRFQIWQTVFPIISESFVVGHGPSRYNLLKRNQFGSTVDSGILRWWYHYGILGVITILTFILSVFRISILAITKDGSFSDHPWFWSIATVTGGWILGALVVWLVLPIMTYSRSFTLFLFLGAMLISAVFFD